jgi:hypothetical protein
VWLKDFRLHTSLVGPHALNDDDFFFLCQETSLGGRVWEQARKEETCPEGQAGNDNHIDLPLSNHDAICRRLGRSPGDAIRDETSEDLSNTVTSKVPSEALRHFYAGVEPLVDEHDTWGDASL